MKPSGGSRTRPEIAALTGLRAWAALWVVAHHHRVFVEGDLGAFWFGLLERGYLGVDIFFTLSGFILAYNYGGRIRNAAQMWRFLVLRLARLYPLHLATLLCVVAMSGLSGVTGIHPGSPERYALDHHLGLHLLMIHAWGFEESLRFNQPSWSVSAEFFAYLCFPVFWWIAGRARSPLGALSGAALTLAAMGLTLRVLGYERLHVPLDHALIRVSGEFLAGCFMYQLVRVADGFRLSSAATGGILAAVAALALSPLADPWMAAAAPILILTLAVGRGSALRAFSASFVQYLGRISYSIYLTHMLTLSMLHRALPSRQLGELDWLPTLGVLGAHAAAILGVAALSYRLIEQPARAAIRSRLGPGETP